MKLMRGGQGQIEIVSIDGKKCARKHLLDKYKYDKDAKHRFVREIELAQKINSPNVIKIIDFNPDDNDLYYTMPYYEGSLADYIQQKGDKIFSDPLSQQQIFISVLNGVKALHASGIIHRDLKPGNILVNGENDVVVCDFGLSKDVDNSSSYTNTGEYLGTERYMSPEQKNDSKHVDERTDIYALGIILDDLTGRSYGYSVQPQLCRIADKASAKEKENRYKNIDELIQDINIGYRIWLKKEADINKTDIINEIAKGNLSCLELISSIDQIINNPDYSEFDADQVYSALSKDQYQLLENESPELCFRIFELIWEDWISSWNYKDYESIDDMASFTENSWVKTSSPKVKGYNLAKLAHLAVEGNRYRVMDRVADLIATISDDETKSEFLHYAKVSEIRKIYSINKKKPPVWIR